MKITSKLPNVGTTIFTVMSKLAQDHQAINLSQGFPNFPVNEELLSIYHGVLDENSHQYVPMQGFPGLLHQITDKVRTHYNRDLQAEKEVLVTAGATQAIFTTILALVHKGEEVIVLDPSYDCYAPAVELCGAKPVHINMNSDFSVDWQKVEDVINPKTKMLIVNNPHNPSGTVFKNEDVEAIEQIMEKYPNLLLLSDEVYEFIFFEAPHISIHTREKIRERTIVVSSFGKTFHVTGWKIGYLVTSSTLLDEIKKVHQFNVFCVNSTAQIALSRYLSITDLSELSSFYQSKRDLFRNRMKNSRFELLPCEGSYFQVARYTSISDKSDIEFAKEMTIKHGVAVIPISGFNQDGADHQLIRFCFAKDDETIIQATEKLCQI